MYRPRPHYDPDQRAAAEHLNQAEPWWMVIYGTWTRLFWAFPTWNAPGGLVLHARTVQDLTDQMREAELTHLPYLPYLPGPTPGVVG